MKRRETELAGYEFRIAATKRRHRRTAKGNPRPGERKGRIAKAYAETAGGAREFVLTGNADIGLIARSTRPASDAKQPQGPVAGGPVGAV